MLLDDGNGQNEVFRTDGLGSVRAVTSATGTVVQTYGTDAFAAVDASC